ncbi:MAG TPA: SRPBCC family protein [Bryobacteraceae bacterium]|nr:SRPBCC family protein [Bryobacteraceae bacterium]
MTVQEVEQYSREQGRARETHEHARNGRRQGPLTQALGWFSIGLGAAELAIPGTLSKLIGVRDRHRPLLRSMGLREIAAGVGILVQRQPAGWMWARVAGDAIDLSLLGVALNSSHTRKSRAEIATAAIAGVTALDIVCGARRTKQSCPIRVKESIAVNKSSEECYRFWRDFQNFPRFMRHLESVEAGTGRRSHWRAKARAGMRVEWDAEIVEDRRDECISWRSAEDADIRHAGLVRFERAPGGRGTILHVNLHYGAPGGEIGAAFAKLFGEEPSQQIYDDLRNFKRMIETGEILTTEGQPSGRMAERTAQ